MSINVRKCQPLYLLPYTDGSPNKTDYTTSIPSTMQAFSAPGKALIAGGYLVLYPEFSAYTIALSSRMHSVLEQIGGTSLTVDSPQFESRWVYSLKEPGQATSEPHRNPFLEAVVTTCAGYFGAEFKGAHITIWSDQGFHSQPSTGAKDGAKDDRFTMHGKHITKVPKTGLGSSAALTVVVVTAIVRAQTGATGTLSAEELQLVHNLSQYAHSVSQGKVGSGFDVATAVYGSINYSRFPASLIDLDAQNVRKVCDKKWPLVADRVALPSTIKVLMGDVNNGSETPSMVRKILEWRSKDPQAQEIWTKLGAANKNFSSVVASDIAAVPQAIAEIRHYLRLMSELADVPVEPPQQTRLLDECSAIDGVLGGVVPGAGGSDAVCILVETSKLENAKRELEQIRSVNWLPLEQENEGLLPEDPDYYRVAHHAS